MKTVIAFTTLRPNNNLINFSKELIKNTDFDVFIFIDDNTYKPPSTEEISSRLNYIQINNNECIKNGFQWVTFLMYNPNSLRVCAWDKALYYFSHINTSYDFIWGLEDDVFIPSIDTLINLTNNYVNNTTGLVVAKNEGNFDGDLKWLWRQALMAKLPLPWYCSMVPALGMSKKLIECIKEYAKNNGSLVLTEILFNTLAMHNNLKVIIAPELSTIVYRNDWTINDFKNNKNNLFHPVKNVEEHEKYRNEIKLLSN